ncbi:MAG: restriction endonuclease subunit S [Gammaproteobacteria bacterium]|nr:restriction endonuclease subunit S [Gammaproteobacteria bacterium]
MTLNGARVLGEEYLVAPGDIIYSKIRPALNKVCISSGDWLCSADMYPVSITESRLQTRFLLYFMLSAPFVQLMVDQSMRVAMPKVNRDKLAACPLLVPDPAEQWAIAAFLDRETAKIDALVARKERLIELLQENAPPSSTFVTSGSRGWAEFYEGPLFANRQHPVGID